MSTGKASEQLKFVKQNHQVSYHRLVTMLAEGIKKAVEQEAPDLELRVGGKSVMGNKITLHITGNVVTEDADDLKRTDDAVRQTMDALKNPSNLLSTLE